MKKATRQFTAWIACLAILLGALAPSVSHALAAAGSGAWIEICSATGSRLIQVADEHNPTGSAPAQKSAQGEHCPFCLTHGAAAALPPGSGFTLAVPGGRQPLPPLYYQSPRPLFIWAAAPARAPPAIS